VPSLAPAQSSEQNDAESELVSPEVKRKREEKERYAVAAIAFCLKHDKNFREHFFHKFCQNLNCCLDVEVEVEPNHSSDLLIRSRLAKKVYAIEFKAGATLKVHQNPAQQNEFKAGYGKRFAELHNDSELFYIVMGAGSIPDFPAEVAIPSEGKVIKTFQKEWSDLEDIAIESLLVSDLYDTLADLRIGKFHMRITSKIKIDGDLHQVASAWEVLTAICCELAIKKQFLISAERISDSESCLGAWIGKITNPGSQTWVSTLQNIIGVGKGVHSIWFGYVSKETHTMRCLWLYCDNADQATALMNKLNKSLFHVQLAENEVASLKIEDSSQSAENDFDWFMRAIHAAAK